MSRVIFIRLQFSFFFLCLFLFAHLTPVFAEQIGLSVYPPVVTIKTQAPIDLKIPITIKNMRGSQVQISVTLTPFHASEDSSGLPAPETDQKLISSWQKETENLFGIYDNQSKIASLPLNPMQTKTLTLHVTLKGSSTSNDYLFNILFTTKPKEVSQDKTQKAFTYQKISIATDMLVSVGNLEEPVLSLDEFKTSGGFYTKGPVPMVIKVGNNGNQFQQLSGTITIKNLLTQASITIPLQTSNVLSHSSRYILEKSKDIVLYSKGIYRYPEFDKEVIDHAVIWQPRLLFGIYKISLELNTDKTARTITKNIYFVGVEVKILIFILISTGIFIILKKRAENMNKTRNN